MPITNRSDEAYIQLYKLISSIYFIIIFFFTIFHFFTLAKLIAIIVESLLQKARRQGFGPGLLQRLKSLSLEKRKEMKEGVGNGKAKATATRACAGVAVEYL